jgi:PilZ domain
MVVSGQTKGMSALVEGEHFQGELEGSVDSRRVVRFPMRSEVRIWSAEDPSNPGPVMVQGLDISESGLAFVVRREFRVFSRIHMELPKSRVSLVGEVRNCARCAGGWRIGVEFTGECVYLS